MVDSASYSIIVVEDDKLMRQSISELLDAAGWRVKAVSRATKIAEALKTTAPDVILSDVRMPGMSGLDLLNSLDISAPPLVLMSAHGDIAMAVQAMQDGAYSFVEKPYEPHRLLTILRHAAEQSRMQHSNVRLKERLARLSGLDRVMLGETNEITDLRQEIIDIADTRAPVLIRGETGTGKELVANALHDLAPNADGPFLALNCAALTVDTFEAEMFGQAGAAPGRFLSAAGGTVFLDEVCACPLPVQAKLLRVIEDKQILPVGATTPIPVAFRVVSATNEDLDQAVRDDRLRQDLLFRLNTIVLTMPPLRARRGDVALLMTHFLSQFAKIYQVPAPEITQDDLAALLSHHWPGNVRELRGVAERRVISERRGGGSMMEALRSDQQFEEMPDTLREAVAAFERELIAKAIRAHNGRMEDTAEALGIGRRTLNEKIVKLGLEKTALL